MRWHGAAIAAYACACGRVAFDATGDAFVPGATVLVDIPDFTSCSLSGLRLTGNAACNGGALELTGPAVDQGGAVWLDPPITLSPSTRIFFEARFEITMTGGAPGDGFAFVAHSDPRGATTMGGNGDGLGFAGIVPSVDVGFDTFQNAWDTYPQTLGVHLDGDWMTPAQDAASAIDMAAAPFSIWVDYDRPSDTVSVSNGDGAKPAVPLLTYAQPITNLGTQVWLGMTASTGDAFGAHRLLALRIAMIP